MSQTQTKTCRWTTQNSCHAGLHGISAVQRSVLSLPQLSSTFGQSSWPSNIFQQISSGVPSISANLMSPGNAPATSQMCTPTPLEYVNPENSLTPIHLRNQKVIQVIIMETHWTPLANLTLVTQMITQNPVTPPVPLLLTIVLMVTDSLKPLCSSRKVLEISKGIPHQSPKKSRLETLTPLTVLTLRHSATSLYPATFILGIILKSLLLTRKEFYPFFPISKVQHLVGLNQDLMTPPTPLTGYGITKLSSASEKIILVHMTLSVMLRKHLMNSLWRKVHTLSNTMLTFGNLLHVSAGMKLHSEIGTSVDFCFVFIQKCLKVESLPL